MKRLSDEQLVRKISKGCQLSFEEFYRRYSAKAYNLAHRMLRFDGGLAEDVVSEAFDRLWRKAGSFRGDSKARSWFYRIVANQALMTLRARKRFSKECRLLTRSEAGKGHWLEHRGTSKDELVDAEDPSRGPLDQLTDHDLRDAITKAIKDLDPDYGVVFCLRDIEELTNPEIAAILNISVPAVKSRLHRARLALRRKLICRKVVDDYAEIVGL